MRRCLFGGSFDPVHAGHLAIAAAAREACGAQRVMFLPAACSPFKAEGSTLFSPEQRLAMLRAATQLLPWAEVSELDLQFPAPSVSWRLVEAVRRSYPDDELFWLMGGDAWKELHLWARPDYLAQMVTFVVYHRGGEDPAPQCGVRTIFAKGPDQPASATQIRQCLLTGTPVPPDWLPPSVRHLAETYLKSKGCTMYEVRGTI